MGKIPDAERLIPRVTTCPDTPTRFPRAATVRHVHEKDGSGFADNPRVENCDTKTATIPLDESDAVNGEIELIEEDRRQPVLDSNHLVRLA